MHCVCVYCAEREQWTRKQIKFKRNTQKANCNFQRGNSNSREIWCWFHSPMLCVFVQYTHTHTWACAGDFCLANAIDALPYTSSFAIDICSLLCLGFDIHFLDVLHYFMHECVKYVCFFFCLYYKCHVFLPFSGSKINASAI